MRWSSFITLSVLGCGNAPGTKAERVPVDAGADAPAFTMSVPTTGRVYMSLAGPTAVSATDAWDLAFEGWDVFTNGGASGQGLGAAFGPHEALACAGETIDAPVLRKDVTGGA